MGEKQQPRMKGHCMTIEHYADGHTEVDLRTDTPEALTEIIIRHLHGVLTDGVEQHASDIDGPYPDSVHRLDFNGNADEMDQPIVWTANVDDLRRWYRRLAAHLVERPGLVRAVAHGYITSFDERLGAA
jgi:hypothetical protein